MYTFSNDENVLNEPKKKKYYLKYQYRCAVRLSTIQNTTQNHTNEKRKLLTLYHTNQSVDTQTKPFFVSAMRDTRSPPPKNNNETFCVTHTHAKTFLCVAKL